MKLLISLFLLLPLISSAQTSVESQPTATGKSSAENRENKHAAVTFSPVGVTVDVPSFNLGATFFMAPDHLLLIEAGNGYVNSMYSDENGVPQRDIKVNSLGIYYKAFLANSFYLKTGFSRRTIEYVKFYSTYGYRNEPAYGFKGETVSTELAIGNQWQFSAMTIGVDWLGVSIPAYSTISDQFYTMGSRAQEQFELQKKQYLAESAFKTQFYLGASF